MTEQRQLLSSNPTDAPEIIAALVGRMNAAGLSIGEVGALLEAIQTTRKTAAELAKAKESQA